MSKISDSKKNPASTTKISRAAEASRNMSIEERAKIMVKAGLVSKEQASKAVRKIQTTE